jgi:hypothetical protein
LPRSTSLAVSHLLSVTGFHNFCAAKLIVADPRLD